MQLSSEKARYTRGIGYYGKFCFKLVVFPAYLTFWIIQELIYNCLEE